MVGKIFTYLPKYTALHRTTMVTFLASVNAKIIGKYLQNDTKIIAI